MIKILIYNQFFLFGISGVDHLRLSPLHYLPYKIFTFAGKVVAVTLNLGIETNFSGAALVFPSGKQQ